MIRTSKAAGAWPLPWGADTQFMLRAGDVIERGEVEADLAELRAGRVFDFQLEEVFLAGVDELLKSNPEDAARVREVAAASSAGEDLTAEDRALLDGAREI